MQEGNRILLAERGNEDRSLFTAKTVQLYNQEPKDISNGVCNENYTVTL